MFCSIPEVFRNHPPFLHELLNYVTNILQNKSITTATFFNQAVNKNCIFDNDL